MNDDPYTQNYGKFFSPWCTAFFPGSSAQLLTLSYWHWFHASWLKFSPILTIPLHVSCWPLLAHWSSSKKPFNLQTSMPLVWFPTCCRTLPVCRGSPRAAQWRAHVFVCSLPLGRDRFSFKLAITLHPQTSFALERWYTAWHFTRCRMTNDFPSLYLFSIAFCQNQPGPLFCTAVCQPVTFDSILELVKAGPRLLHLPQALTTIASTLEHQLLQDKTDAEIHILGRWSSPAFQKYWQLSVRTSL